MSIVVDYGEVCWLETRRLRVEFTEEDSGDFVDPTTLTLRIVRPGRSFTFTYGVESVIVRLDVGKFNAIQVFDDLDVWQWRWSAAFPTEVKNTFGRVLVVAPPAGF